MHSCAVRAADRAKTVWMGRLVDAASGMKHCFSRLVDQVKHGVMFSLVGGDNNLFDEISTFGQNEKQASSVFRR